MVSNEQITCTAFSPKDYQQVAIENAYTHFTENDNERGKLIMACGSGKSLTAYWIAEKLEAKTILVAVPSLALVEQTIKTWAREFIANDIKVNLLAVCSDKSIAEIDVSYLKIKVSTDVESILNWFKTITDGLTVVFTTYQSSKITAKASSKAKIVYDFGVMDEAHKTTGHNDKKFSHLLFNENIDIKKRMFMTATEKFFSGSDDSIEIVSMDNIAHYGDTFYTLTFKDAIQNKPEPILCDYKIITMVVTSNEIASYISENESLFLKDPNYNKDVESEMLASIIALHKAISQYDIKHTVSFHSNIKRAKDFQKLERVVSNNMTSTLDLETFHINSKVKVDKRQQIIKNFTQAPNSLITNSRCLTEGIDIPSIDCVIFADPKQSTVDIVQAIGRVLRTSFGKKNGYIILPVLIDDSKDITFNKSYKALISILQTLATMDERVVSYFTNIADNINENGRKSDAEVNDTQDNEQICSEKKDTEKVSDNQEIDDKYSLDILIPENIIKNFSEVISLSLLPQIGKLFTPKSKTKIMTFDEAKQYVRDKGITTRKEFLKIERPVNMPSQPENRYSEWNGWKDFFSTSKLSFKEARAKARALDYCNPIQWKEGYKENKESLNGVPQNPNQIYKDEWISWEDWFGNPKYMPYEESKTFMIKKNLKNTIEWKQYSKGTLKGYSKRPINIPTSPDKIYPEWDCFGAWLGTGRTRKKKNLSA